MGNLEKLADNKLFKRIDLFAPFRRRKQPKRRPNRPGKRPQILKPVENTKKVKRKPEPEVAPKPAVENPALSVQEEIRTGKSLSEALILGSTNLQYDKRLFIDLPVQYMKTTSSEHVVYTNCFLFCHSEQFMCTTCSELVVFMY